jgi:hypothetical protein
MRIVFAVLAGVMLAACATPGYRGNALNRSQRLDGGTIAWGVEDCAVKSEDPLCYPSRAYDRINTPSYEQAKSDAATGAEALAKANCRSGFTIDERGTQGWTKLAPSPPLPAPITPHYFEVWVYSCKK